jgi:DeoR family transcriptional regulator, suf operon transcriptional repressor
VTGTALPQLSVHKGLRGAILLEIKRSQPLTAKQLAATLGVSPNAIRHHLKELVTESLIVYGREQHGVGAPTYAYRLSAVGESIFPKRYEETLTELLERVAEKDGRGAVVDLFADHYAALTRKLAAELGDAPPTERVAAVARSMSEAGYMAEWEPGAVDGTFRLSERNCAIRAVAERFPEACAAEHQFLRDVLGAAVERRSHIVRGCNACEYAVSFEARTGADTAPSTRER